ncbi:PEP-CTERM sorting domain-containing protein [bacterium]|nr:PEP-CTERM sorting domain-containing protein [bacterium]
MIGWLIEIRGTAAGSARVPRSRLGWAGLMLFSLAALSAAVGDAALVFNFTAVNTLAGLQSSNPGQYTSVINGFAAAGNYWASQFNDDVTVNIDIDYPALSAGTLGQAGSDSIASSYSQVRTALTNDRKSAADATAVANLPAGSGLSFLTNNAATGNLVIDNNGSANNTTLDVNRANAKALGLLAGAAAGRDAAISFSSNYSWDFDRSNGITPGTYDFVGVAMHEIGHALGFVSGVDTVDYFSRPNGPEAPLALDGYRVFSVLDLYRRGSRNGGGLDFAVGGSGTSTPYFSIDGGTTALGQFSTGAFSGDGRQASHWKDNAGLGLLDPTLASGELAAVTPLDLLAMDVIGWNAVPEPSAVALAVAGLTMAVILRRRA